MMNYKKSLRSRIKSGMTFSRFWIGISSNSAGRRDDKSRSLRSRIALRLSGMTLGRLQVTTWLAVFLLPVVVLGLWYVKEDIRYPENVRAFGHLVVDLGVPSGDPIFVVNNMLPGDCEVRSIKVSNGSDLPSHIAVRSDNEIDNDLLSEKLQMKIEDSSNNILYNKTLKEFFNDSNSLDGVPLTTIPAFSEMTYEFNICFDEQTTNEYQNTEVIFDLLFGEVISPIQLPAECSILTGQILFVIEGTDGNDDLEGSIHGDLILAKGGRDKVDGNNGNDCIVGGDGNDKNLDGGQGDDIVLGGAGKDKMEGGSGNDILHGGDNDDKINGESGEDIIYGGEGKDKIDGSSGDDFIYGENGDDKLEGGPGDDYIDGGTGFDKIDGDPGEDTCFGEDLQSCEL